MLVRCKQLEKQGIAGGSIMKRYVNLKQLTIFLYRTPKCEVDMIRHTPGDFFLRLPGGIRGFKNPPLFLNSVSRGGGKSGGKGGFLKNIYKYPQVSEIALKIELQSAF